MVCSNETNTCDCRTGYKWSTDFNVCYQCPEGWLFYKDNCYSISSETIGSWNEAQSNCVTIGGRLATFNTEVVVDRLTDFFTYFKLTGTFYVIKSTLKNFF